MTTLQMLAREVASAGLLEPEKIERILREQLRAERNERLKAARATLAADPLERR